jgi:DNA topoisomerase IB
VAASAPRTRSPAIRLRRSDTSGPGIRRRRRGKGFEYLNPDGSKVDDAEVLGRINELVIPPAWNDVWISPYPGGHIQATGVDARGRKQYLYHQKWRQRRDQEKFDDMLRFARALPELRARVDEDLASSQDLPRDRVLACAVRLLDKGFFRIGSEDYAVENETYGLATMRKEHVQLLDDATLLFDYPAKHGKRRVQSVVDGEVAEIVGRLKRRRGGGDELLAFKEGRAWVDVRSPDINHYLKDTTGLEISAKDFRTWNATVLAAVALSVSGLQHGTKTGRKRATVRAIKEVSHYLGNTPAVARASYIDPRVFDRFNDGLVLDPTIAVAGADEPAIQGAVEEAVLDLIAEDDTSDRLTDADELDALVA